MMKASSETGVSSLLKTSLLFIVLFLLFGCSTTDKKEIDVSQLAKAIKYNESREYPLTSAHVKCYVCDTGKFPLQVSDIRSYRPRSSSCSSIFTADKNFESSYKDFDQYRIETKIYDMAVTFIVCKGKSGRKKDSCEFVQSFSFKREILECLNTEA